MFYEDIDAFAEEIKSKGGNLSDYFNYGFTPDSWKQYSAKIRLNWEGYIYKKEVRESYEEN